MAAWAVVTYQTKIQQTKCHVTLLKIRNFNLSTVLTYCTKNSTDKTPPITNFLTASKIFNIFVSWIFVPKEKGTSFRDTSVILTIMSHDSIPVLALISNIISLILSRTLLAYVLILFSSTSGGFAMWSRLAVWLPFTLATWWRP